MSKILEKEVILAQEEWKKGVLFMSQNRRDLKTCCEFAQSFVDRLYAYDDGGTLFKPTLASIKPFRVTCEAAVSYFVGSDDNFKEDKGFALKPWVDIEFDNIGIHCFEETAYAMGHYTFFSEDQSQTVVEYTFAYVRSNSSDNLLRISLHHSSLPYSN